MFHCYVGFLGVIFLYVCWKLGQSKGGAWKWHSVSIGISQCVLIPTFFLGGGGKILLKTCGRTKCAQRRREEKRENLGKCEVFCRIFVLEIWKLREFPESSQSSLSDSLCREFHSQRRQFCFKYIRRGRNLPKTNISWVDALQLILL